MIAYFLQAVRIFMDALALEFLLQTLVPRYACHLDSRYHLLSRNEQHCINLNLTFSITKYRSFLVNLSVRE